MRRRAFVVVGALAAALVCGGVVLAANKIKPSDFYNAALDTVLMVYDDTGLKLTDDLVLFHGTDKDFATDFDSASGDLVVKDAGGNVMWSLEDGGSVGNARVTGALSVGLATTPAGAKMEVEDDGTAQGVLLKLTVDDENVKGLLIGNDTFAADDAAGLLLWLSDAGVGSIDSTGGALNLNVLNDQAIVTGTGLVTTGGGLTVTGTLDLDGNAITSDGDLVITPADFARVSGRLHVLKVETGTTDFQNPVLIIENDQGTNSFGSILHFQTDDDNVSAILFGSPADNDDGQIRYWHAVGGHAEHEMEFYTNSVLRMTIDNGGNMGLGFSTSIAAQLAVNGGVHVGGITDPGDNNLIVDGTLQIDGDVTFNSDDFDLNADLAGGNTTTDVGQGTGDWLLNTNMLHLITDGSPTANTPRVVSLIALESNEQLELEFIADAGETEFHGITWSDGTSAPGAIWYQHSTDTMTLRAGSTNVLELTAAGPSFTTINLDTLYFNERAAADTTVSGQGQFWVSDTKLPMFTDSDDVDHRLHGFPMYKSYTIPNETGAFYVGGFYELPPAEAALDQAGPTQALGSGDHGHGAHALLVAEGAGTVPDGVVEIEVSGTSITDSGVRTASDTEVIVADVTAMGADEYFETALKWIGPVTYTLQVASGAPATFSATFNYGLTKYDDYGNNAFVLTDVEIVGKGGVSGDATIDFGVIYHSAAGWSHSAAGFGPPPFIASWGEDYGAENEIDADQYFAWKRDDLSQAVNGANGEGILFLFVAVGNNAIDFGDIHVGVEF